MEGNSKRPRALVIPPNRYGVFAAHSSGDVPVSKAAVKRIIEGPIAAVQPAIDAHLAAVEAESQKVQNEPGQA